MLTMVGFAQESELHRQQVVPISHRYALGYFYGRHAPRLFGPFMVLACFSRLCSMYAIVQCEGNPAPTLYDIRVDGLEEQAHPMSRAVFNVEHQPLNQSN